MRFLPALLLVALLAGPLPGQGVTVQLPTYSFFNVSTTVSVPDGGAVYLGGVNRAASGSNEFRVPLLPFRPFKNRAIGQDVSSSSVWVTAQIHDFNEMDEYLLSQPTAYNNSYQRAASAQFAGRELAAPVPVVQGPPSPAMSLAQLRAEHSDEQVIRQQEAATLYQRGRNAEAEGKAGVARIYYQMASRRADDRLKAEIAVRMNTVNGPAIVSNLAEARP